MEIICTGDSLELEIFLAFSQSSVDSSEESLES